MNIFNLFKLSTQPIEGSSETHPMSESVAIQESVETILSDKDPLAETEKETKKHSVDTEVKAEANVEPKANHPEKKTFSAVIPKDIGKLDMVIAFDTTGSMAQYIGAVRKDVTELIPQLFKENDDLRLGIVAFGDYCDMKNPQDFGDAYQVIKPTNNVNELIGFVVTSKDTHGGDGPEFYELVIKKIVEETPWREGSTRVILLIADSDPHELGYSYGDCIKDNTIDWRVEARKAADKKIKIDTVTITDEPWFKELSAMTNGISVPFHTGYKTADLVRASAMARGSMKARMCFDDLMGSWENSDDEEMKAVFCSYKKERDDFDAF